MNLPFKYLVSLLHNIYLRLIPLTLWLIKASCPKQGDCGCHHCRAGHMTPPIHGSEVKGEASSALPATPFAAVRRHHVTFLMEAA